MREQVIKEVPKAIHINRIIGKLGTENTGPTCIFFGGVHGNEPSGVIALQQVLKELEKVKIHGSFYAIGGNISALANGERYHEKDLNRLWTEKIMTKLEGGEFQAENEDERELIQIYDTIKNILNSEKGPFYFFDLHTTSSKTTPFITVNDSILNRKFTELYPLPLILGIEEYLDGPMLSYYNEKGFISFGFEGGEHYSTEAIENHKAFIYLSLHFCGLLDEEQINFEEHHNLLAQQSQGMAHFYEIYERFEINEKDQFKMKEGYKNFQRVRKNELIAEFNGKEIKMKEASMIFMPLYQSRGNDAYFLIKKTAEFFLKLSILLRQLKIDRILPLLPGVLWCTDRKEKMLVDLKIARFLTKPFLHLLGYRARQMGEDALIIKNREANSRKSEYKNEGWYK